MRTNVKVSRVPENDLMDLGDLVDGVLTDENCGSSYGLPVVMIDGEAHGPKDIGSAGSIRVLDSDPEAIRAAKAAGFTVYAGPYNPQQQSVRA